MHYFYFVIRSLKTDEVIGIVKLPDDADVFTIFHPGMPDHGVQTICITEPEYTTYQAFEMVPEYKLFQKWNRSLISERKYVDIYDPTVFDYFAPGKAIVRKELMP